MTTKSESIGVYARALFDLALASDSVDATGTGLASIVAAFDEIAATDEIAVTDRSTVVAEVTTAHPLTDALRASLQEKLSANIGKPVTLREHTDDELIGGIRIDIDGRVFDGSISKQLTSIRSALTNSSVGGEA